MWKSSKRIIYFQRGVQYYQRKLKGSILLDVKVNKVVINNWKKGLGLTQVMKSSGQMLFLFLRPNNDKHVSDISTMCHALVHASLGMHSPTGGWKRVQKRRTKSEIRFIVLQNVIFIYVLQLIQSIDTKY
jgi:hypothetical protein